MAILTKKHVFRDEPKHVARQESVVDTVREFFQGPIPKQYWTLGASCGFNCKWPSDCEYHHVTRLNLVTPKQYHSVDIDPTIYDYNATNIPEANWYEGDFFDKIIEYDNKGLFQPSVINYDSIFMPINATDYLARMMRYLVTRKFDNIVVIANTVWKNPQNGKYQFTRNEEFINHLGTKDEIVHALNRGGWNIQKRAYHYNGHDGRTSKMMTTIFTKPPHLQNKSTTAA